MSILGFCDAGPLEKLVENFLGSFRVCCLSHDYKIEGVHYRDYERGY